MEPEVKDAPEVLETPEVVEEPTLETPETPDERDERIAQLERDKAELESKNKQLFERVKKAPVPSKDTQGLSTMDVLYLAKADIHTDDLPDVLKYAEKMGVSVSEAHKFYKPILAARAEERKTENATHTKGGARGGAKTTGEDLLRKAEKTGEVPDTVEGLNQLFEARQKRRLEN